MNIKSLLTTLAVFLIVFTSFGQAPDSFKYQAVIRNTGGVILDNQSVGIRLKIEQGSIGGTVVYTETFAATTNAYGIVNLEIGTGTTTDDFTTIDWGNGPYYIETAVDYLGGMAYVVMGTSQLLSVPYALHSKTTSDKFFKNMQGGKVDVGNVLSTETIKIVGVSFPKPFTNPPNVICTAAEEPGTIYDDSFNITVREITTTGFVMVVNRVDGSWWGQDIDAFWMAFE